ncbi:hypothetical protein [Streptomyces rugosispiralis]|uniref:Uncharacterized protein n=1 Tax=Streptomyces rugosispiralis TaxID=2967341 RepID=A0ABT1VDV3_9ACTN|nr:hypothetical protein [Streptomyces rugosispiralis]MCQ8194671.1 hypothetical protein [Streptomyces rugosispiralis]
MTIRLTADRDLAKKVTAHALGVDDARELLLALGMAAEAPAELDQTTPVGSDYVPPAKRRTAWTRMAGEMNADGKTVAQIAAALAVDVDTAAELIGDYWAGVR